MKKTGIIILSIGLLFTIFTTIGLLVKEHVTDPAKIDMAQIKIHHRIWEPMLGAMAIVIGVLVYKAGRKSDSPLSLRISKRSE